MPHTGLVIVRRWTPGRRRQTVANAPSAKLARDVIVRQAGSLNPGSRPATKTESVFVLNIVENSEDIDIDTWHCKKRITYVR